MKRISILITLLVLLASAWSDSVEITQIENRHLLIDGTMELYFLPRGTDGNPTDLSADDSVELFSIAQDGQSKNLKYFNLEKKAPLRQGINFLLLMDNSGSMYEEFMDGGTRLETARFAVDQFFKEISNPADRAGLSVFNTFYTPLLPVDSPGHDYESALNSIEEPTTEESYTELYRAMHTAADELAVFKGRRAMIVLSDGENYPFLLSGDPHPEHGENSIDPSSVIDKLVSEAVSVYGVHIGNRKDEQLDTVAAETGGRSFFADNRKDLSSVYRTIREEIQQEYRLSFHPPYSGSDVHTIMLKVNNDESRMRYYMPHFLGEAPANYGWFFLIAPLLSLALIVALLFFIWERPALGAELNVLQAGKTFSSSTKVSLTKDVTVIGAGAAADMTIVNNPALKENHASVRRNERTKVYTISSDTEFRVNNRITKQHTLQSGDVLDLEGTTVVFDKPEE